jgi:hypothetical protein
MKPQLMVTFPGSRSALRRITGAACRGKVAGSS